MCGVCGSFGFAGSSDQDAAATIQMTKLMERRGPDDEGFWSDKKHCTLGFRRLAILDLSSTGHQPMLTPDGRYALVYNGEVYNFHELREELRGKGISFRSSGDTEVVLHGLARWGKEALNRLNGMFALAFYDVLRKRLLLARDHAGIKPLYYLSIAKGVVFGSQYDQIMAHPWARGLSVSSDALAMYLRLGYIPAPYAILDNTYMLEPGAWLEVSSDGQIRRGKFFEFPIFTAPDLRGEAAEEAVDEAVTRAVRRHLVSDVPVGTFLSGGIDSPLVAAKMVAVNNAPVRGFTLSTHEAHLDELPDAAIYARQIGVEHIVERVTPEQAFSMVEDVVASCGEPFADYSVFPTMVISRLASEHVKVMLSGDGGDELFWGYPDRCTPFLQNSNHFRYPYWFRTLHSRARNFLGIGNGYPYFHYESIGDWCLAMHSRISEHNLHAILPELPEWPLDCGLFRCAGGEPSELAQWLRWNEFVGHLTMVLLKVDRASMYHSLEVRVPLLDREVLEVAMRVSWDSCLDTKREIGKKPLRRTLARHVTHQTQAKRGFEVPMNTWLRGPLKTIFEEAVMGKNDILGVPLDRQGLRTMFGQHIANQRDHARGLWTLLSLALWEQKHFLTISDKS